MEKKGKIKNLNSRELIDFMRDMKEDYVKAQKDVETLIAIGLYQAKISAIKGKIREIYEIYKEDLKPIDEVRVILTREIPEQGRMSDEVVKLRRIEMH
ncbi:MAG: hypothetical protein H3Z54_10020 [archaeon]|nr:hypothetical protein [archaeon]